MKTELLSALLLVALAAPVIAEEAAPAVADGAEAADEDRDGYRFELPEEISERVRNIERDLLEIRDQAILDNPEILEQASVFRENVLQAMRDDGIEIDALTQGIRDQREILSSSELSGGQRDDLRAALREDQEELERLQARTMRGHPELAEEKKAIEDRIDQAMGEVDPRAWLLKDELKRLAVQMELALVREAQKNRDH